MNELKKLLTIIDSTLSKEDLIKAFQDALFLILKQDYANEKEFKGIKEQIEQTLTTLKDQELNKDDLKNIGKKAIAIIQEYDDKIEEIDRKLKEVKDGEKGDRGEKGEQGEKGEKGDRGDIGLMGLDGRDGLDADPELVKELVIREIEEPIFNKLTNELPKLGERVRDGLELLVGEERLSAEAIKGLPEFQEKINSDLHVYGGKRKFAVMEDGVYVNKLTDTIDFKGTAVAVTKDSVGKTSVEITESDPVWTADKPNYALSTAMAATYVPLTATANWNTAYGWGNHATAGYLKAVDAATTYLTLASATANYVPYTGANANVDLGTYHIKSNISTATAVYVTGDMYLQKTGDGTYNGVIRKGGVRFIHDFNPPEVGGINPIGYNLFIGEESGNFTFGTAPVNVYSASYNTGIGGETLKAITGNASYNTVVGGQSGRAITSASSNTIIGAASGTKLTSANGNTIIGSAGLLNATNGAIYNAGIGVSVLSDLTTGDHNLAIGGLNTGVNLTTGSYNTLVGSQAGYTGTAMANCIFIGYKAGYYERSSNTLLIDYSDTGRGSEATARVSSLIYGTFNDTAANQILCLGGGGKVGIGTITPTATLDVNGTAYISGSIYNSKFKITEEGGYAVKFTNQTGSTSIIGYLVSPSSTATASVYYTEIGLPDPIGITYETVGNGQDMWIVCGGIANVYFATATTRGHIARACASDDTWKADGMAISELKPTSPFATDKHFQEIGHVLESRVGEGLAKCIIHFN